MSGQRLLEAFETVDGATLFVLSVPALSDDLPLTPAERDIAVRLLEGCTNAAIAKSRGVSVPTVAKQVASIFQKLGARNRAELVTLLLRDERRAPRSPSQVALSRRR